MSETHADPHDEALARLAQLGTILVAATETAVRIRALQARPTPGPARHPGDAPQRDDFAAGPRSPGPEHADPTPLTDTSASPPGVARTAPTAGPARGAPRSREAGATADGGGRRGPSRGDVLAVHRDAHAFFGDAVQTSWVPDYLTQRSLSPALDEPWTGGYAPDGWTHLTDHLRQRGWDEDVLVAAGVSRWSRRGTLIDHFRDRLVLPMRDEGGQVVAFIGRAAPGAAATTPKYLNSPRTTVYDKSTLLLGLAEGRAALTGGAIPVLTEGPLDAIAVTAAGQGQYVGLAACGTALSDHHISALARVINLPRRLVLVATDHDPAGDAAAAKAYGKLAGRCADQQRVHLPPGQDPAGLAHDQGSPALASALGQARTPLLDTAIDVRLAPYGDQLQWLEGRVRAAHQVAPLIAALPLSHRPPAIAALAARLDLMTSTIQNAVHDAHHEREGGTDRRAERGTQTPAATTTPAQRPPPRLTTPGGPTRG